MGTQQILMIILSVIVVGSAVAVGIQMFDTQADNQARAALSAELLQQGAQAQAYYRTPKMMGGGGNGNNPDIGNKEIARYIDRKANDDGTWDNMVGDFELTYNATGTEDNGPQVTIVGKAASDPTITLTVKVPLKGNASGITME